MEKTVDIAFFFSCCSCWVLLMHIYLCWWNRRSWFVKVKDNRYLELKPFFSNEEWSVCEVCLKYLPPWRIGGLFSLIKKENRGGNDIDEELNAFGHSFVGAVKHFDLDGIYWVLVFVIVPVNLFIPYYATTVATRSGEIYVLAYWYDSFVIAMSIANLGLLGFMISMQAKASKIIRQMELASVEVRKYILRLKI